MQPPSTMVVSWTFVQRYVEVTSAFSTRMHSLSHCAPWKASVQMSHTAVIGLESDGSSSNMVVHLVSPRQFSMSSHSIAMQQNSLAPSSEQSAVWQKSSSPSERSTAPRLDMPPWVSTMFSGPVARPWPGRRSVVPAFCGSQRCGSIWGGKPYWAFSSWRTFLEATLRGSSSPVPAAPES